MPKKVTPGGDHDGGQEGVSGGENVNQPKRRAAGDRSMPTVQFETACFFMPEPNEPDIDVKKKMGSAGEVLSRPRSTR